MVGNINFLRDTKDCQHTLWGAGSQSHEATHEGTFEGLVRDAAGELRTILIPNVWYVPGFNINLLSTSHLMSINISTFISRDDTYLIDSRGDRLPIAKVSRSGLPVIDFQLPRAAVALNTAPKELPAAPAPPA
jgi:hypothetical protein